MTTVEFLADLRRLSTEQLEHVGQRSLLEHVRAQAEVARERHGPLTAEALAALLTDPACLRHPVRLVFEFGEMALHQFGQPDLDWRNTGCDGRVLYLRPMLRDRPEWIALAVAYLIPLINYGEIVTDEICLHYGAALLGLAPDDYYRRICELADRVGAEVRPRDATGSEPLRYAAPVGAEGAGACGGC